MSADSNNLMSTQTGGVGETIQAENTTQATPEEFQADIQPVQAETPQPEAPVEVPAEQIPAEQIPTEQIANEEPPTVEGPIEEQVATPPAPVETETDVINRLGLENVEPAFQDGGPKSGSTLVQPATTPDGIPVAAIAPKKEEPKEEPIVKEEESFLAPTQTPDGLPVAGVAIEKQRNLADVNAKYKNEGISIDDLGKVTVGTEEKKDAQGLPDGSYRLAGKSANYQKINGQWYKDANLTGDYQPISGDNAKSRTEYLEANAQGTVSETEKKANEIINQRFGDMRKEVEGNRVAENNFTFDDFTKSAAPNKTDKYNSDGTVNFNYDPGTSETTFGVTNKKAEIPNGIYKYPGSNASYKRIDGDWLIDPKGGTNFVPIETNNPAYRKAKLDDGAVLQSKPDGVYLYPGSKASYKRVNGDWFIDPTGGSNYVEMTQGDVAKRKAQLDLSAVKAVKASEYNDLKNLIKQQGVLSEGVIPGTYSLGKSVNSVGQDIVEKTAKKSEILSGEFARAKNFAGADIMRMITVSSADSAPIQVLNGDQATSFIEYQNQIKDIIGNGAYTVDKAVKVEKLMKQAETYFNECKQINAEINNASSQGKSLSRVSLDKKIELAEDLLTDKGNGVYWGVDGGLKDFSQKAMFDVTSGMATFILDNVDNGKMRYDAEAGQYVIAPNVNDTERQYLQNKLNGFVEEYTAMQGEKYAEAQNKIQEDRQKLSAEKRNVVKLESSLAEMKRNGVDEKSDEYKAVVSQLEKSKSQVDEYDALIDKKTYSTDAAFLTNPKKTAQQLAMGVSEDAYTIIAAIPKDITPKQQFDLIYERLLAENDRIAKENGLNTEGLGDASMKLKDMLDWDGFYALSKEEKRWLKNKATLNQMAPLYFNNSDMVTENGSGFFESFTNSFYSTLFPNTAKAEGFANLSEAAATSAQKLQEYGFKEDDYITPDVAKQLEEKSKVDFWSRESFGGMVGTTAAIVAPMMLTAGVPASALRAVVGLETLVVGAEASKVVKLVSSAEKIYNTTMKATRFGRFLIPTIESAVKAEIAGQIFSSQEDELNFLSFFAGGVVSESLGAAFAKLPKDKVYKYLQGIFGNKIDTAINVIKKGGEATARGIGETGEEAIQELVGVYQDTDSWKEMKIELEKKFGTFDQVQQFVVSSFILGSAFGLTESDASREAYDRLPPEERRQVDVIIEAIQDDLERGDDAVREFAENKEKQLGVEQTIQENDKKDEGGVSGQVGEGQESVEGQPIAEPSQEATSPSGVVQEGQGQAEVTPTTETTEAPKPAKPQKIKARSIEEARELVKQGYIPAYHKKGSTNLEDLFLTSKYVTMIKPDVSPATTEVPAAEATATEAPKSDIKSKSVDELEKRQFDIEESTDENDRKEFNEIEKELELREWSSVLNAPLNEISSVVDGLMAKDKDMPNGFGSYMDKSDARQTKEVARKYSEDVSNKEAIKDFKDAFFGNPNNWYADALKLRESVRAYTENGGSFKDLLGSVQSEFESDGFTEEEAASVINAKLNKIKNRGLEAFSNEQAREELATETTTEAPATEAPTISTNDKEFNEEEFVRDVDNLEREKGDGGRNIGLFSFKDKFVKLVKGKRKTSKEDLERLKDRVADMPNVFPGLETIDLPNGSQAIVMDKATGKLGNELTEEEINNIPQEHWDDFEQTIRELSNRGVQTDLTKRSNVLYDKDKGFQFIDLEGASVDGSPTEKFFEKDGKEFYHDFERYPVFPIEYTSAKDMFTNIENTEGTAATTPTAETTAEPVVEGRTISQIAKDFADKIRSLKSGGKGNIQSNILGPIWDKALEIVAKTIEVYGMSAEAIQKAIEAGFQVVKKTEWFEGLSKKQKQQAEADYRQGMSDRINEGNMTRAERTAAREFGNRVAESTGTAREENSVQMTESEVLRKQLKDKEAAGKTAGISLMKIRKQIRDYAKNNLPKGEYSKAEVDKITAALNTKDLGAALDKIDAIIAKKTEATSVREAKATERKRKAKVKEIKAKVKNKRTILTREGNKWKGKITPEAQKEYADYTSLLDMDALDTKTQEELDEINDIIDGIVSEGKADFKRLKEIADNAKRQRAAELIKGLAKGQGKELNSIDEINKFLEGGGSVIVDGKLYNKSSFRNLVRSKTEKGKTQNKADEILNEITSLLDAKNARITELVKDGGNVESDAEVKSISKKIDSKYKQLQKVQEQIKNMPDIDIDFSGSVGYKQEVSSLAKASEIAKANKTTNKIFDFVNPVKAMNDLYSLLTRAWSGNSATASFITTRIMEPLKKAFVDRDIAYGQKIKEYYDAVDRIFGTYPAERASRRAGVTKRGLKGLNKLSKPADGFIKTNVGEGAVITNGHLVDFYNFAQTKDGVERLEKSGVDVEKVIAHIEGDSQLKEYSDFLMQKYKDLGIEYEPVYISTTGTPFPGGIYYPSYASDFQSDFIDEGSVIDSDGSFNMVDASSNNLKQRNNYKGNYNISMDAHAKYLDYVKTMEHAKHFMPIVKSVNELFSTMNVPHLIKSMGINDFNNLKNDLIRVLGDKPMAPTNTKLKRFWQGLRTLTVIRMLGFKTASLAKQFVGFTHYWVAGINEGLNPLLVLNGTVPRNANELELRREIIKSDYIATRLSGVSIDVEMRSLMEQSTKTLDTKIQTKLSQLAMIPIRYGDKFAILFGPGGGLSFATALYRLKISEGMTHEEAKAYAFERFVTETEESQQTTRADLTSEIQLDPAMRMIGMFRTGQMAAAKKVVNGIRTIHQAYKIQQSEGVEARREAIPDKQIVQSVVNAVYFTVFSSLAFAAISTGAIKAIGDDDEDVRKRAWYDTLADAVASTLQGYGMTGYIMDGLVNYLRDDEWKMNVPMLETMFSMMEGATDYSVASKRTWQSMSEEERKYFAEKENMPPPIDEEQLMKEMEQFNDRVFINKMTESETNTLIKNIGGKNISDLVDNFGKWSRGEKQLTDAIMNWDLDYMEKAKKRGKDDQIFEWLYGVPYIEKQEEENINNPDYGIGDTDIFGGGVKETPIEEEFNY